MMLWIISVFSLMIGMGIGSVGGMIWMIIGAAIGFFTPSIFILEKIHRNINDRDFN